LKRIFIAKNIILSQKSK